MAGPVIIASMADCLAVTARQFHIPVEVICSAWRHAPVVRARFAAIWLMRQSGYSLPMIGRLLRRDHTSILHAERRARRLLDSDMDFSRRVAKASVRLAEANT